MTRAAYRHASRLALLAGLVFAPPATATTAEIRFSGTAWDVGDQNGHLDGSVTTGSPFTGVARFEDAAVDQNPDPTLGTYRFNAPPFEFSMEIGNYTFVANLLQIGTRATHGTVNFTSPNGLTVLGPALPPPVSTQMDLAYESEFGFPNDTLGIHSFELEGWLFKETVIFLRYGPSDAVNIFGFLTAVTIVPEPATIALLAAGLAGLAGRRGRRRRAAA
jgi:hypothetical protein